MNLRPKYSLKFFLIFATAVTVFLGYSQIRRQKILEVCDSLRNDGYIVETPKDIRDLFWQRKPIAGIIINFRPPQLIARRRDSAGVML